MILLVVYIALIVLGQSATIATALTVERLFSPATSVLVFIGMYFTVFVVGWKLAVWLTVPGKRLGAFLSKTPSEAVKGG